MLFRYFEHHGEVLTAVTAVKSRANAHERSIRQFRLGRNGVEVGEALRDFEGVLSGLPSYRGGTALLGAAGSTSSTRRGGNAMEQRVLILAPFGRDADVIAEVLHKDDRDYPLLAAMPMRSPKRWMPARAVR